MRTDIQRGEPKRCPAPKARKTMGAGAKPVPEQVKKDREPSAQTFIDTMHANGESFMQIIDVSMDMGFWSAASGNGTFGAAMFAIHLFKYVRDYEVIAYIFQPLKNAVSSRAIEREAIVQGCEKVLSQSGKTVISGVTGL